MDIVYEDNHLIVVVKPQNVPTQLDDSNDLDMLSMVKKYIKEKYNKPGNVYVGLVHRLDRPTGGLMVFAKTGKCASRLTEQLQSGEMHKKYLAVVNGVVQNNSEKLVNYLKKNPKTNMVAVVPPLTTGAKLAELQYEVLERKEKVSLVSVDLFTGRSHQIRVQMKHIGHPVYGDVRYGGDILAKGHNLALWAYELSFNHPITKQKMTFKSCPPNITPWSSFDVQRLTRMNTI